jgi:DNA topoisomerase-1
VRHGNIFVSLGEDDDVLTVGLNRAVSLIADAPKKKRQASQVTVGEHPRDGKPVTAGVGRFGPFVKHGNTFASLPKGSDPSAATMDQAVELLDAQADKKGSKSAGKSSGSKASSTAKAGAAKSASAGSKAKGTTSKAGADGAAKSGRGGKAAAAKSKSTRSKGGKSSGGGTASKSRAGTSSGGDA